MLLPSRPPDPSPSRARSRSAMGPSRGASPAMKTQRLGPESGKPEPSGTQQQVPRTQQYVPAAPSAGPAGPGAGTPRTEVFRGPGAAPPPASPAAAEGDGGALRAGVRVRHYELIRLLGRGG